MSTGHVNWARSRLAKLEGQTTGMLPVANLCAMWGSHKVRPSERPPRCRGHSPGSRADCRSQGSSSACKHIASVCRIFERNGGRVGHAKTIKTWAENPTLGTPKRTQPKVVETLLMTWGQAASPGYSSTCHAQVSPNTAWWGLPLEYRAKWWCPRTATTSWHPTTPAVASCSAFASKDVTRLIPEANLAHCSVEHINVLGRFRSLLHDLSKGCQSSQLDCRWLQLPCATRFFWDETQLLPRHPQRWLFGSRSTDFLWVAAHHLLQSCDQSALARLAMEPGNFFIGKKWEASILFPDFPKGGAQRISGLKGAEEDAHAHNDPESHDPAAIQLSLCGICWITVAICSSWPTF